MARFLGIDFGTKRIGLALSDEEGILAFPESVILNDAKTLGKIKDLCQEKGVGSIILGESLNLSSEPNKLMVKINKFKKKLEEELDLKVYFEKEFMTSFEARRIFENLTEPRPDTARKVKRKRILIDASAAALILQRYLDRKNAT